MTLLGCLCVVVVALGLLFVTCQLLAAVREEYND